MTVKSRIDELAILGGSPASDRKLHVGAPNIGDKKALFDRIEDILERRWLTNRGFYVRQFEEEIAALVGIKHCIAMVNGTVALEIAARALGMAGEVIVPSFTFIATAHALQWQQIQPVFCDIDPRTHNLDPARVEALVTPRTGGILATHVWGRPCDTEALAAVAHKHGLKLLFDAAHAFACSHRGKMIGTFGHAEVLSFHATKFFNTFEGGAIVTDDDELAEKIRLMKNFGFAGMDRVVYIGTNGKMNEVAAAMGLTGLESLERFIGHNYDNYLAYREGLAAIPGIRQVAYDESQENNFQYIVVEVDPSVTGISRDRLVEVLHRENILVRRYFYPGCHRMEPYRSQARNANLQLPHTDRLSEQVMSLPTGTAVSGADITGICSLLRFIVTHGREVDARLERLGGRK